MKRSKWVTPQTHSHLDWQLCKSAARVYKERAFTCKWDGDLLQQEGRKSATRALQPSAGYWLTCFSLNSWKQPSLSWFEVLLWDVWSQTRTDVNICHERVQRFRLPHLPEPWLNSCCFYSVRGAIAISFMYLLISSALLMCVRFSFSAAVYVSCQLSHTVSWLYTPEQHRKTHWPWSYHANHRSA